MRKLQLEPRMAALGERLPDYAEMLEQALGYAGSDPQSSLTKSRSALERLVLDAYQRELGAPPKKPLLGEMLRQRPFTDTVERRILSRMNSIRDMGNLGPHGEAVDGSDAERVLYDLCDVIDWYLARYPNAGGTAEVEAPAAPPPTRRKLGFAALAAVIGFAVSFVVVYRMTRSPTARTPASRLAITAPAADTGFRATPIALRWQALGDATEYEVEVERVDAAGRGLAAPSTVRVPLPYLLWPWDGAAPTPGRYRFQVRIAGRADTTSAAREFTFYPSVLDRVVEAGELRVGMEMTYHRPFAYFDVDSQKLIGFDVDLADEIARRLGVERKGVAMAWDELFTAIEDDRIDVVISAVTITDVRAGRYGFSQPYFTTGQRLTARADDRRDLSPGRRLVVGTQKSTSSAVAARGLGSVEIHLYDTLDLAVAALSSHEVDVLVCDEAISPAATDPGFRFVGPRLTTESYGVMMRHDDELLRQRVDAILGELSHSGWLTRLAAKYGIGAE